MKTFFVSIVFAFALISFDARGQCGRISLIGEFNSWSDDLFLTRDPVDPEDFSVIFVLTAADDMNGDGIIETKFRENAGWENCWGSTEFPTGTGIFYGPNIPVPIGSYLVTFNCVTLEYYFQETCGLISLIGEFNGWADDYWMNREIASPDEWSVALSLNADDDTDGDGFVQMKFRMNSDWNFNWGDDAFPSGIGVQNGLNIPVPLTYTGITTDYIVSFNCATGAYNFTETSGPISLSGEFNDFTGDLLMERDADQPEQYSALLSLYTTDDQNDDGFVEMKFRENADWTFNWGSGQFPSGTAVPDGPNIMVPIEYTGVTTDYLVTFNYSTLAFNFQATSGAISIIGAFIGWMGDIPMNRDPESPNLWNLTRCWYANSELKFRENKEWSVNWGNTGFPSGIGVPNGPNIPLIAGTYDVAFNSATGAYNFVTNPDACGEIGLIGDFNGWGDNGQGYPSDIYMLRDPVYPSQFSLDYLFADNTNLLFRLNADPNFVDVWGGTLLCQTGVQDLALLIPVTAGNYHITFDCNSGDYCLTNLYYTTSFEAPKVFSMIIDGDLDESGWDISQEANKIIWGTPVSDLNEVNFGVSYSDSYLYVGLNITDYFVNEGDIAEFFVDGDNSGGEYDEHDVFFTINGSGFLEVIYGPPGGITVSAIFKTNPDGYTVEAAIPWDDLGISPTEGDMAGFDIMIRDDDYGWVEYVIAWSGTTDNYSNTSPFGKVIFGPLNCGFISLYNPEIGDIILRTPSDQPTTYVATYDFDADFGVVFRQDKGDYATWGSDDFPSGTAEPGGPEIPVIAGRYRVSFDCNTGAFSFTDAPAGDNVALADFTEDAPVIDGQLDEYDLVYDCNILVAGTGPINNTVNWGARWNMESLYIGVQVTDETIYGSGNPWDNDGVEFYIDGNNDKDGVYDNDFDTQVILDALNQSVPWFKADGVLITNYEAGWSFTGLGYNVEMRLGWDNFGFEPGRGRVMGWSLGNDDNDYDVGRDYQSVWFGTGNNWSNTSDLGDLQLADGPYTVNISENTDQEDILIYPNPTDGAFFIMLKGDKSGEKFYINVFDISGRLISIESVKINGEDNLFRLNPEQANPGLYIVKINSDDGSCFVKKLIIQ
jgi:hypothetical protein